jgi:ABC-type multidrug transport system fused ATPase/permease subunit
MLFLKKLLFLLTPQQRNRAVLLLVVILISALLDVIGVASILPFIAVLTNPSLVETNIILNTMFQASIKFGIQNITHFLFCLGIGVFILLIISLSFKAYATYIQIRYGQMCEYIFSKRLVEGYLHQPYSWFLNRNSADLGKTILSEAGTVAGGALMPLIDIIAKSMLTIGMLILLIIADPKLALIVGFSIGGVYALIFYFIRKYLNRIGKIRLKNNELRFVSLNESFGAIKEIKVGGLEQNYIELFSNSAQTFAKTQASSSVISQLPRYFLEAIAFGGILLIILYVMTKTGNFNNALPIISLYVFAGYRLMPALQQIYISITQITFVGPSVDKLYEDIYYLKPLTQNQDQGVLSFEKEITLKNINYNYPNTSRKALKNISLNIPRKSTVGFVGPTGSGKTTAVDIILGLLEIENGTFEVDGKIISKQNVRSWQRSIGYVPQYIYLADKSISANIAFGVDLKDVDQSAIEKASKIANLHKFVIEELPDGYQTVVGERGVRLSGGQRQRIGIARALYHNPKLLILDEATSALDNLTEKAVMDSLNNLSKNITIILIAHRLSSVKKCDKIFLLDKGEIKNEGTFEELVKLNDSFRLTTNS